HRGHTAEGLQALAEAYTLIEQHEERWWEAEVCRLRGVLLLQQAVPQPEEAEACFQRALEVTRRQQAKSLELRAAMSLRACGSSRTGLRKPTSCWRRSTAGSPRALTPSTCRKRRHCWTRWRNATPVDTPLLPNNARRAFITH